uniref:Uncharacterized protein n=1 Tax=Vespula pensylvanica TaxID=30213 RepID=A0A834JYQ0_VESPE|nr:hypothetical protein H0235_016640 [Vespula pensylvanica]
MSKARALERSAFDNIYRLSVSSQKINANTIKRSFESSNIDDMCYEWYIEEKADRELSILIKQPPTYVTPLKLALVSFQNTREKDEHEDEEVEEVEDGEEVEEVEEVEEDEGSHGRN